MAWTWMFTPRLIRKYRSKPKNRSNSLTIVFQVIKAGKTRSGCTIHFVTEEVDGGPILVQLQCEVHQGDTTESLKSRVQELEGQAFLQAVEIMRQRIVLGKEYNQVSKYL